MCVWGPSLLVVFITMGGVNISPFNIFSSSYDLSQRRLAEGPVLHSSLAKTIRGRQRGRGKSPILGWCKSDLLPKWIQIQKFFGFYQNGIVELRTKVNL